MIKRIVVVLAVAAMASSMAMADVGVSNPADLVGVFEYNTDIGKNQDTNKGYGFTMDMGIGLEPGLGDSREYLLQGGGKDVWGNTDGMHMAYNLVEGDVRMSADFDWIIHGDNGWAKYGVMIRNPGTDVTDGKNQNYSTMTRKDEDRAIWHWRAGYGQGSGSNQMTGVDTSGWTFGIQRVSYGPFTKIQGLVDRNEGAGWEVRGDTNWNELDGEVMVGAFVTSHDWDRMAQVKVYNVSYEYDDIQYIGDDPVTTLDANPIDQCTDIPGFQIRVRKFEAGGWGGSTDEEAYINAGLLMDGTTPPGILDLDIAIPSPPAGWNPIEGKRIDPVVNLNQDDGDPGAFQDDSHYPGIDLFKEKSSVSGFADDADDDNDFAVEVIACIYLTPGYHMIGANSDDGTLIEIGGVEVGRTEAWKGSSNRDFLINVVNEGFYSFRALNFEGGGGANLELHEVLVNPDGSLTRILLGATDETGAFIGSPVYVPEPATIALLGLGGLSLIRRKRS